MRRTAALIPILTMALVAHGASTAPAADTDFTVLAYHDVVANPGDLTYDGITLRSLTMQFDWLRENGHRVVSLDDVVAAQRGERPLPPRAVLLTFDDGYRSFYTHVYPLLRAFNYPAVFSVVGSFLDVPVRAQVRYGTNLIPREGFVSWGQLRELQRSGLVEIGSHTYGLHTTIYTNPQGGEVPAAVGHGFIRRRAGLRGGEKIPLQLPPPRFGDVRSLLRVPFRQYLSLAIEVAQAAIDYAYDPRTGRYETDEEYKQRVRADLERNSDLLEANLGVRPRVITWPYGRWNEVTMEAARQAGMPISLTLDVERANTRELGRIGRFYATQNPGVRFVADTLTQPPQPELLRGLCVNLDEIYAPSAEEQDVRLGRILDRILAFRPTMVLLGAASSAPEGGVYFPTDRLPVRADLFSRAAWQIFARAGAVVYGWLPAQEGWDVDTARAVYGALARSVPFDGLGFGPLLAATLPASGPVSGVSRWDPRTPRWVREAQDRTRAPERARLGLRVLDAVTHYQPAIKLLEVVELQHLRRPTEMAVDTVDYVGVRWDGPPADALRKLRDLGWLEGDHWGRLVYFSARGVPAEWRRVQRAGVLSSVYCPDRLLDRPAELAAMGEVAGGSSFPFRP
jgi:peptidoglycan/xylan/chitin deacetylase (PgdA/CDA1 family)